MAGNSQRSLVEKLGIKEGSKALFVEAPKGYAKMLGALPKEVVARSATGAQVKGLSKSHAISFIQCFCRDAAELKSLFPALKGLLTEDGMLWISWPKLTAPSAKPAAPAKPATGKAAKAPAAKGKAKAAPKPAENPDALDENQVRDIGLAQGLVDVKVCAVDDEWSGLKFMFRLEDRSQV